MRATVDIDAPEGRAVVRAIAASLSADLMRSPTLAKLVRSGELRAEGLRRAIDRDVDRELRGDRTRILFPEIRKTVRELMWIHGTRGPGSLLGDVVSSLASVISLGIKTGADLYTTRLTLKAQEDIEKIKAAQAALVARHEEAKAVQAQAIKTEEIKAEEARESYARSAEPEGDGVPTWALILGGGAALVLGTKVAGVW